MNIYYILGTYLALLAFMCPLSPLSSFLVSNFTQIFFANCATFISIAKIHRKVRLDLTVLLEINTLRLAGNALRSKTIKCSQFFKCSLLK